MIFSLTATTQRLQEGVDGTNININPLDCTWRVEMKGENDTKEEEAMREGNREIKRKTLQQSETKLVIKLVRNILELISLDCADEDFLQLKPIYLPVLVI